MIDIPRRQSLALQAAESLRKGIGRRVWVGSLPGERRLCELFKISRPTLRCALRLLAKEGLVAVEQGKHSRILRQGARRRGTPSHLIGLITSEPVAQFVSYSSSGISEMRQNLAENGFTTELLVCDAPTAAAQIRSVENFLRENRIFCCILISVRQELQEWFARSKVPTLLYGSCHATVHLPSLDIDQHAVCRHAAGYLLGLGHRRIALVLPDSGLAGDLASERGFREGMTATKGPKSPVTIVRHNGTAQGVSARLDALFNSAEPPTALLVAKPICVFIVIIYLLKRGLSVPDTVSLMARERDFAFDRVSPSITHYAFDDHIVGKRLTQLMLQLAGRGELVAEPNLIFPKLKKGGSVKDLKG